MPRQWCRVCDEPVRLAGCGYLSPSLSRAVHELTGLETGADGHLAAPIDINPVLIRAAEAIEAEFAGVFDVVARFGFLRADWADLSPGAVAAHYEADTAEGLRVQLRAALAMAVRS